MTITFNWHVRYGTNYSLSVVSKLLSVVASDYLIVTCFTEVMDVLLLVLPQPTGFSDHHQRAKHNRWVLQENVKGYLLLKKPFRAAHHANHSVVFLQRALSLLLSLPELNKLVMHTNNKLTKHNRTKCYNICAFTPNFSQPWAVTINS